MRLPEYKNPKHAAQVITTLTTYAFPAIADVPVRDIQQRHILEVLQPIWTTKTETADRLRGRIENVLAWATTAGFRSGENPARWRGNLENLLPRPSKVSKIEHHRAVPLDELGEFTAALASAAGMGARALEFLILTAARSGEVRGAVWSEIDLGEKVWTVPAQRMKAGREHRVPLSTEAVRLLNNLPRMAETEVVFPSSTGRSLSDMTVSSVMRRMGVDAVPHGFRSSFRDWAAERTSYPSEMAEMALAHTISSKVEAAYRRGDLFQKRRAMMEDWARFVVGHELKKRG